MRRRWWLLLALVAGVAFLLIDGWEAFGKAPADGRLARMQSSPNWREGLFRNSLPLYNDMLGVVRRWFDGSEHVEPSTDLPITPTDVALYDTPS